MPAEPSIWSTMPLRDRLGWLLRFQRLVAAAQPRLCQLMHEEVGKPVHEGLMADVAALLGACKWLYRNADVLLRDRIVGDTPFWLRGTRLTEQRLPLGKVGIIATWNYPVQLLGIQLIEALVAGNCVVVKPSERCPRTQTRLLELAIEAGLPSNTLTWVGATRESGANMLATQKFDHVIFTGSTEVGQRIAQSLSKTLTPATLELSGRDSAFVLEDANPKHAARALWASVCMNAGQTCMAPRRVLVIGSVYNALVEQFAKLASKATPLSMIDEHAAQKCKDLTARALASGARDAATLAPVKHKNQPPSSIEGTVADETLTRRFRPTVLVNCNPNAEVVEGRHFGPVLAVVRCISLDEALVVHKRCDQHLTASIFTRSEKAGQLLASRLGVTNVMINDCIMPSAHPGVSIGGHGMSGVGLSRGSEGLLALTRPVYVSTSSNGIAALAKFGTKGLPDWQAQWLGKAIRWWYGAKHAGKGIPAPSGASAPDASQTPAGPLPVVDEPGTPKQIVHQTPAFGTATTDPKRLSGAA